VVFAQPAGGQVRVIQAGAKLSVGDTIGTEKGAFALVVFNDGSRVALRPESAIAIRGFSFQPDDPSKDQMSVQLLKGWLRNVSGQIGKRGNQNAFDLKVNDTTIGIRGTDFGVRLCDEECAARAEAIPEGVLPQSGRLGQLLSSNQPVQRLREGVTPQDLPTSGALFLGDVVTSGNEEALLGLDDGTRLVLGPATRLALRAEEDERGRRAVRVDLLQGNLRLATPTQPGARLYGLLVNAGQLLGVRQDTALDLGCEKPAAEGEFACDAANVVLRRGRSEVLTATGLRSLLPGTPQRLLEPAAVPPPVAPAAPTPPATPAPPPSPQRSGLDAPAPTTASTQEWDTWAPGAHPMARLRTLTQWRQQQARQADPTTQGLWLIAQAPAAPGSPPIPGPLAPSTGSLFDPLSIAVDAARPPIVAEAPKPGIYTAVFEGQIAMQNPRGQIQINAGQGGFAPVTPTVPPTALPASPAFMEKDTVLNKQNLTPGQCPK
jgi:ferric-dicitrate binding protein FerR (iron transport regulator)